MEGAGERRDLVLVAAAAAVVGVAAFAAGHMVGRWGRGGGPLLKRGGEGGQEDDGGAAIVDAEQLSRNAALYGDEGLGRIRGSYVVVIGLGGVGSHAAMSLARSGVGRLRLIDYDQVTVSSLNRHACATRADVGHSKGDTLDAYIARIVPSCRVEVVREVFQGSSAEKQILGSGAPDFVIDAIDNRQTKTELIGFCVARGVRVVSCMGAGGRVDPSRVQMGRLSDTRNDPLCKTMRLALRKANVDTEEVAVVFSTEKPAAGLLELHDGAADNPEEYQMLPNFRVRIMPVVGTIPAIFGMAAATYVLNEVSGKRFKAMLPAKLSAKKTQKMVVQMYHSEEKAFKAARTCRLVTVADAQSLVADCFDNRCVVSGAVDNLALRRFDRSRPASPDNLVLLSEGLARKHDAGEDVFGDATRAKVAALLQAHN